MVAVKVRSLALVRQAANMTASEPPVITLSLSMSPRMVWVSLLVVRDRAGQSTAAAAAASATAGVGFGGSQVVTTREPPSRSGAASAGLCELERSGGVVATAGGVSSRSLWRPERPGQWRWRVCARGFGYTDTAAQQYAANHQ
ncbi:hypothetical protein ACWCQL_33950 [Streptomyces sp. NPDC002073]